MEPTGLAQAGRACDDAPLILLINAKVMSHLAYCHGGWVKRSGPIKSMILLGSPLMRLNPTYIYGSIVSVNARGDIIYEAAFRHHNRSALHIRGRLWGFQRGYHSYLRRLPNSAPR